MKKRALFLTLTAGALLWGFGTLEARAGFVPLPTTLDVLSTAGNFTTVQNSNELDTFSNFTFSASAIPPTTPVLTAAGINVAAFGPVGLESGLTFSGALFAPANTIVDYQIGFTVTAPAGFVINDALLSGSFGVNGGNGSVIITELLSGSNGTAQGLEISSGGSPSETITFNAPANSYIIQKDILLNGGSNGATVSIVNQAFSSAIPEPTSIALLGIGMTGFLAFRRLFKRASVA